MSGFARAELKRRELLGSGRLFGLRRSGGAVVPSFAAETAVQAGVPETAVCMTVSPYGDIYLSTQGKVWRSTGGTGAMFAFYEEFSHAPRFASFCGEDCFTIAADGTKAVEMGENSLQPLTLPALVRPVCHYSRMFAADAADGYTLRWSQPCNAKGWEYGTDGAGYITFGRSRGQIERLISCNERLYVVCGGGFYVLRAEGEAGSFAVENTDTDADGVVADTAAVCAGRLLFFTSSGLYAYGSGLRRLAAEGLEGFSQPSCAAAFGGYYFACGKLDGRGVIACVDVERGEVSYIEEPADCCCVSGGLLFHKSGAVGRLVQGVSGRWESGLTDLGSCGIKYLDGIEVNGAAEELTVTAGGRTRVFTGVSGRVKVGMKGRFFAVTAKVSGALYGVTATFAVRG